MNIENHNLIGILTILNGLFSNNYIVRPGRKGFCFSSPITTFKLHGNECIQGDYISFYYQLIV